MIALETSSSRIDGALGACLFMRRMLSVLAGSVKGSRYWSAKRGISLRRDVPDRRNRLSDWPVCMARSAGDRRATAREGVMMPSRDHGPGYGRRLSRRGLLKGRRVSRLRVGSLAALDLPLLRRRGRAAGPARLPAPTTCRRRTRSWSSPTGRLHRPAEEGRRPRSRSSRTGPGSRVTYTDDVNDNNEFFAKVQNQLGACAADRPRHDRADRLDGRPDDRPRLDPAARPDQDAQRRTRT